LVQQYIMQFSVARPKGLQLETQRAARLGGKTLYTSFNVYCRYVIWWERGYQEFDKGLISATVTKVKGIALTNFTQLNISVPGGVDGIRIWDVADYVVPPQVTTATTTTITTQIGNT